MLQFIDRARFMVSSSSTLTINLSEAINRIKCNSDVEIKNVKHVRLNKIIGATFLNKLILKKIFNRPSFKKKRFIFIKKNDGTSKA